jgi:hypothetical protein
LCFVMSFLAVMALIDGSTHFTAISHGTDIYVAPVYGVWKGINILYYDCNTSSR